jgi:hypothetical protein
MWSHDRWEANTPDLEPEHARDPSTRVDRGPLAEVE